MRGRRRRDDVEGDRGVEEVDECGNWWVCGGGGCREWRMKGGRCDGAVENGRVWGVGATQVGWVEEAVWERLSWGGGVGVEKLGWGWMGWG